MEKDSTRRKRFESVASRRVQNVLDSLESLSKCANKSNYEFSDEDIRRMFAAIENKIRIVKALYGNAVGKDNNNKFKF